MEIQATDRNVQFDPDRYGWPWISRVLQLVIARSSVIAIKTVTVFEIDPQRRGIESIWASRCCSIREHQQEVELWKQRRVQVTRCLVFEAAAVALLALQDEKRRSESDSKEPGVARPRGAPASFLFPALRSAFSTLFVYQESVEPLERTNWRQSLEAARHPEQYGSRRRTYKALKCGEMIHHSYVPMKLDRRRFLELLVVRLRQ